MLDFSIDSRFDRKTSFQKVRIGDDAPLSEADLNEVQDIQNFLRETSLSALFPSGFVKPKALSISGIVITFSDELFLIGGRVLKIKDGISTTLTSSAGDHSLYIESWVESVRFNTTLRENGYVSGSVIPNHLLDSRYGQETSRRHQIRWRFRSAPQGATLLAQGKASSSTTTPYNSTGREQWVAGDGDIYNAISNDGYTYLIKLFDFTISGGNLTHLDDKRVRIGDYIDRRGDFMEGTLDMSNQNKLTFNNRLSISYGSEDILKFEVVE